ncbi:MAG: tRNA (adenosine(37)-N6)-threonylcarbamoyltransferase complex ATPase subunit type 1 TsaE [Oscillospiraceae bacterium]|nr:tRNA (adenosine(37)-N6)-threonylcarbamoyltransferase complex ATPase subunit type 1 TsaE [Oscillospiraceae bacterium]
MDKRFVSNSEKETFEIGKSLADRAKVFLLYGGLGAGKTVLVRGICAALGVRESEIHSPTFAIVNEYQSTVDSRQLTVFHFDAYRLSPKEWVNGGFDEYLEQGVCLIEWAENVPDLTKNEKRITNNDCEFSQAKIDDMNVIKIKIEGSGDEPRCITIDS